MRIAIVHNYYQQHGGEDTVSHNEKELLLSKRHEIFEFIKHNDDIKTYGLLEKIQFPLNTVYNIKVEKEFAQFLDLNKPEVVHFHNTFPLISPSAYYACSKRSVAIVQSLHNPRLMCPAATFYRNEKLCEDCLGKRFPWPGIVHACYHESRAQTSVIAAMLAIHNFLRTWGKQVHIYIVFTEFYRKKFIEGGFHSEDIVVKPHFLPIDPWTGDMQQGEYALFIGRLEPSKGIRTLLKAWQKIKGIPLKIRGDGVLLREVENFIKENDLRGVEIVKGYLSRDKLFDMIKGARFLIWPSEGYYEAFGLVAIEAYACGVPVISSRIGVMPDIVEDKRLGLNFNPGNSQDLASKVEWAWTHEKEMQEMGKEARKEFERKYTSERNYEMLMKIYKLAIEKAEKRHNV